jgi:hypothetical protein
MVSAGSLPDLPLKELLDHALAETDRFKMDELLNEILKRLRRGHGAGPQKAEGKKTAESQRRLTG